MAEQFTIPTPGDVIAGKYHILEELGRGAYGVVFKADQPDVGRTVALKTLLPQAFLQPDIVERFQREAQLISRLNHPNIVRLYDYGLSEDVLYMAMEYIEGRDLMTVINEDAPMEPGRVTGISAKLLSALQHAHDQGIVHRDLKPDNIVLVAADPLEGHISEDVRVLDFGISKLIAAEAKDGALKSLTQDGTVLGTPHYMSPENIVGDEVDHKADLYAFGVMLYEMLTGTHPFDGNTPSAVMVKHLRDEPEPLPQELKNSTFDVAIFRCLEKQPLDRIGSASEIQEILQSTPEQLKLHPRPPSAIRAAAESSRASRRTAFGIAAVIVAVLVVSIGWKVLLVTEEPEVEASTMTFDELDEFEEPADGPPELGAAVVAKADPVGDAMVAVTYEVGRAIGNGSYSASAVAEATAKKPRTGSGRPTKRPKDTPTVTSADPVATQITVSFLSTPTNADVFVDGTRVGKTPTKYRLPKADQAHSVLFKHIGYKEKAMSVNASKDSSLKAVLDKTRIGFIGD